MNEDHEYPEGNILMATFKNNIDVFTFSQRNSSPTLAQGKGCKEFVFFQ